MQQLITCTNGLFQSEVWIPLFLSFNIWKKKDDVKDLSREHNVKFDYVLKQVWPLAVT